MKMETNFETENTFKLQIIINNILIDAWPIMSNNLIVIVFLELTTSE